MDPKIRGKGPLLMTGETYEDCLKKIYKIYGSYYQPVSKREVAVGGFLGLFKKKQWEVMYYEQTPPQKQFPFTSAGTQMDFEQEKRKILEANKSPANPQMKLILDEMQALRRDFDEKTAAIRQDEHATIMRIEDLMIKNEFTPDYIKRIIDRIRKEYSLEDLENFDAVQKSVVDWIGETISITNVNHTARPQVLILVGPTGVGKTTTVAKLAAKYISARDGVQRSFDVRMLTIDGYRIGAKNQLETYGELMGIPVSLCTSSEEFKKQLTMYGKGVDVILVDTIGHSPRDYTNLAKMRNILEFQGVSTQVFLTVSASTKASDLRTIMQQYEIFGYSSLIITKLDETESIGTIISIMDEKNKSAAYFTTGQRVPKDLEKAEPVRMLIQLSEFKIDRNHIEEKFLQKEEK